jgi:hypothetical protein
VLCIQHTCHWIPQELRLKSKLQVTWGFPYNVAAVSAFDVVIAFLYEE